MDSDQSFLSEIIRKLEDIQSNTCDEDINSEIVNLILFIETVID